MLCYEVEGEKRLDGIVKVSGAKNASLPIIGACVLNGKENILHNVPDIYDVHTMIDILEEIGCKVKQEKDTLIVDSSDVSSYMIPEGLMRKMRSSVVLVGAIVSRFKKAIFSHPGGWYISLMHFKKCKCVVKFVSYSINWNNRGTVRFDRHVKN